MEEEPAVRPSLVRRKPQETEKSDRAEQKSCKEGGEESPQGPDLQQEEGQEAGVSKVETTKSSSSRVVARGRSRSLPPWAWVPPARGPTASEEVRLSRVLGFLGRSELVGTICAIRRVAIKRRHLDQLPRGSVRKAALNLWALTAGLAR